MSRTKLILLAASLSPALGACSSNFATIEAASVADAIGEIKPSRNDTCDTLKQIAAQSSRIRTIKLGREIVVAAPKCTG